MCLTVKDGCKVERAQKDIKVYKRIDKHENYWSPLYSPQMQIRFKYKEPITALDEYLNPIKNLTIRPCYRVDYEIYEGFHSRINKINYRTNSICIIPKWSEICYGTDNDIVSNQLIVFKNYFQYLIYKLKKHFKNE
jgi:hypothetical protein